MTGLSVIQIISILLTLVLVFLISVFAMRLIKTSDDLIMGGKNLGASLVTGSLVGAFIGGTSTIGTAQMAYIYGINGVWFTLGGGLGCFLLAFLLAKPLKQLPVDTIPQIIKFSYGRPSAIWGIIFISIGMLINIAAQVLSAIPVFMLIFNISYILAAILMVVLIVSYAIFGGIWATSLIGIAKAVLLNIVLVAAGYVSLNLSNGFGALVESLGEGRWLVLTPNGLGAELGSLIAVVIGFVSTQTYLQIIFSAKSVSAARKGAFFAGLMIPFIGISCTLVGMFMHANHPSINPAEALPLFVVTYLNPWFSGLALATLIISLVMTGAALTIGVTTIITKDIYQSIRAKARDKEIRRVFRGVIALVILLILVIVLLGANMLILQWAFIAMAFRGVSIFLPLLGALFFKGKISKKAGLNAIIFGPLVSVASNFFDCKVAALYPGLLVSSVILLSGFSQKGSKNKA